jgi:hypothetical protein
LTCMWDDGVYLGVKSTTGELVIGTKSGVWRTRTVRRKPVEERWAAKNMLMVGGVPWNTNEADENPDGQAMRGGVIRLDGGAALGEGEKETAASSSGPAASSSGPEGV